MSEISGCLLDAALGTAPAGHAAGEDQPGADGPGRTAPAYGSRGPAVAAALVCSVVALATSNPLLLLVALVVVTAALLTRRLPADLAVPAAVLALTGTAAALGMGAALLHVDLLAQPRLTAAVVLAGALGLAAASLRRGGRRTPGRTTVHACLRALPALLAAALGLMQGLDVRIPAAWALYGTDLAEHMRMLRHVQDVGALDYTTQFYPRGLHMLLALVSVGLPRGDPARLMDYDLRLMAGACWLATAAVLATAAAVTRRTGAALRMSETQVTVAFGLLGLCLLASNPFLEMFVMMGAAPSLIALLALWALPLALLSSQRTVLRMAAVTVAAVLLLAQLWQPLVVVPVCSFLACAAPRVFGTRERGLGDVLQRHRAAVVAGLAAAVVAFAGAEGPVAGAVRSGGFGLAGTVGHSPRVPVVLLAASVVACLRLRGCGDVARSFVGGAAGLLAVVALELAGAGNGLDITQWYPNKTLWFLVVFLGPVTALAIVTLAGAAARLLAAATVRLGPAARVTRIGVVAALVAAVCALWLPRHEPAGSQLAIMAAPGGLANESTRRYDIAREEGARQEAVLPMFLSRTLLGDPTGAYVVSKLLSFQTGQPVTHGSPAELCSDLRAVAAGRDAVVVTTLQPAIVGRLLDAQHCDAKARVIRLPGLGADAASQSFRVGLGQ